MEKNSLVKKVSGCIAILAAGMLIGSGICYAKETNHKGYEVPDLSKAAVIGDPRYDDLTDKIDGPETRVDHYQVNKQNIFKASVNGNVFLYAMDEPNSGEVYAIADLDGDGVYETKYSREDLTYDEQRDGGGIPDFPAKKDLPPEWVFK